MDKYEPVYAKGIILVRLKVRLDQDKEMDVNDDFAAEFGNTIGYSLQSHWMDNFYFYNTPEGREDEAIKDFKKYDNFVESAERFDAKEEKRYETLDTIAKDLQEFRDDCLLPDKQYHMKIDEFIQKLNDFKKL